MTTLYSDEELERERAKGHAEGFAETFESAKREGHLDGRAEGRKDGHALGVTEGRTAGAAAERERIKSILCSEYAKGREATAQHFALATELDADTSIQALKTAGSVISIAARAAETVRRG